MAPMESAPNRPDAADEVAKLRRSMVQQLTVSNKLVKAVFDIDRDYFGSRFQSKQQEQGQAATAFSDYEVATQVVETLAEELQGAAAFADSPILRDHIANMIAGIEDLRGQLMSLEQASLDSVGLPSDKVSLKARVFPETNPLACLSEATGFVRETQTWVVRTVERLRAVRMMLQEAERARAEAETAVPQISNEEITTILRAEIEARDQELDDLRKQAAHFQDEMRAAQSGTSDSESGLQNTVQQLQADLDAAADQVTSDQAEVRSLVVEIERLAANCEQEGRPDGKDDVDDLIITVQVLRESMADRHSFIATLTTAADAVLREWFAWMQRREALNLEELAHTKAFVAKHEKAQEIASQAQAAQDKAEHLHKELTELRAQVEVNAHERKRITDELCAARDQAQNRADEATAAAAKAQGDLKVAQDQTRAAVDESKTLQQALSAMEVRAKTSDDALAAMRGKAASGDSAVKAQQEQLAAATAAAEQAKKQTADYQQQIEAKSRSATDAGQRAEQAQAELRRLQAEVTSATATASQATAALQKAEAAAKAAGDEAAQAKREAATLREQVIAAQAEVKQAQTAAEKQSKELQTAQAALAELEKSANQAKSEASRIAKQIDTVADQQVSLESQRDAANAELAQLRASAQQAAEKSAKAVAVSDQELAQVRGKVAELDQLRQSAQKERDEARARLDDMRRSTESLTTDAQQKAVSLAKEVADQRAREEAVRKELAEAQGRHASITSAMESATKEIAAHKDALAKRQVDVDRLSREVATAKLRIQELETQVQRAQADAKTAAATAKRDLETVQGKLASSENREKMFAQERETWQRAKNEAQQDRQQREDRIKAAQIKAAELTAEIESTKLVATAAASERDKLRRDVERLQGDQTQLGKKLEERESQLTARLTETSRHLAELKQVSARLEGERDRARQDVERLDGERKKTQEARAREGTAVWAKRLADTAADSEEVKVRAAALEHKLALSKQREADLTERLERAEKTGGPGGLAKDRSRIASSVAMGDSANRMAEMKALLIESRDAVKQAKVWKDTMSAKLDDLTKTDQAIIQALMDQVRKLGGQPKL